MAHVHTFNNVIITLTNAAGEVISWSSAGKMGFRGSKKEYPYAAQTAATDCAKVAYDMGLRKVKVYVKGPGAGRESAIRTIHGAGIEVLEIIDVGLRCLITDAVPQPSPRVIGFRDIRGFAVATAVFRRSLDGSKRFDGNSEKQEKFLTMGRYRPKTKNRQKVRRGNFRDG